MASELPVIDASRESGAVRFHLSLNVDDLGRSIDFFQVLFDRPATRRENDYAKFELDEPPLVLSLIPNRAPAGGKLNHLGFRLADSEALVAMQRRLEMAGISTTREDGVQCCYSRQTKFWAADPDGNLWELYTLEDEDHHDVPAGMRPAAPSAANQSPAPSLWAHRLGEAVPEGILAETGTVDEVLLQGTFNGVMERGSMDRGSMDCRSGEALLAEVLRVLKPGGSVTLHQLTAVATIERLQTRLPGPAVAVECVPTAATMSRLLQAAGFVDVFFEKLGEGHCFVADGVECRETRLSGRKPPAAVSAERFRALYKGPARRIEDDRGQVFVRGQWVEIDQATRESLLGSPLAGQFVLPE